MPHPNTLHGEQIREDILALRIKGKTTAQIAKATGVGERNVRVHLARLATEGRAPGLVKAPPTDGMGVVKTTVQYDAVGNIINEWRRLVPHAADVEAWVQVLESRVAGKAPRIAKPVGTQADLLLEIPIPDHHMGMLSWAKETGADYDCDIATSLLVGAVASVISESPRPGKIVLTVLGDFYHADNRSGTTERSGNALDMDSRFVRRVDAGIEALCQCIDLASAAAEKVEVISISGNHDWHSIKWLSRVLAAYYRNNKRITIRAAATPRQYLQHGKVMLAYMHGDTMKAAKFSGVIPAEAPAMWAATEFRYGRVGHWHHRSTEEYAGVVVETLPTLAAPDAYAAEGGYMSRRALTAYLWSAQYGLRSKMERGVAEIRDKLT